MYNAILQKTHASPILLYHKRKIWQEVSETRATKNPRRRRGFFCVVYFVLPFQLDQGFKHFVGDRDIFDLIQHNAVPAPNGIPKLEFFYRIPKYPQEQCPAHPAT